MKFSVSIVNYASWPLTLRCLESLRNTGYEGDYEVVVVDNDTVRPPDLPPEVRLLRTGENLGFGRAHNRGIASSTGEISIILNPDTVVERDFFGKLDELLSEYRDAGIVGPRILDSEGEVQLSARREVSLISGLLGRTSFLTRLFPKNSLVKSQFPAVTSTSPATVDWVSGACMAIRREAIPKDGAFDERFFMYFEDADLCRRVRQEGWRIYYAPQVEVVHQTGGSSRSKPKSVWMLHKSAFLYHRKHGAHGPLNLYSAAVLLGLAARALVKLASGYVTDLPAKRRSQV
ncbi:MAG: glycosyltransferase family 2 protein [Actinomycetota bacterium]|nr:glycosyltransferase family 2 protein [Actinomycetota bacterium]